MATSGKGTGIVGYNVQIAVDADPAHEAHFHFDSGLHGATPNYRICQ
jgi:hypothetical protein